VVYAPAQGVTGQNTHLGYVKEELSAQCPIWGDASDRVSTHLLLRNTLFDTGAVLPSSGRPFPDSLSSVQVGASYQHRFENNWTAGLSLSGGSASDRPFNSIREMNFGVSSFLRIPVFDGRDAWMFSLSYQPTGQLAIPIPGVAYLWNPDPNFRMSLGLPFSMWWRPVNTVVINLTYVPLTNVVGHVTWTPAKWFSVYGGYESGGSAYYLADRAQRNERFTWNEDRLVAGIRLMPYRRVVVDLTTGYMFDRRFFQSAGGGTASQNDRINVGSGAFLAGSAGVRW
jgi:hypothetical protein